MPKIGLCVPFINKYIAARVSVKRFLLACALLTLFVGCGVPIATPVITQIIDPTQTEIPTKTLSPHSPSPENTATLEATAAIAPACPPFDAPRQIGSIVEFVDASKARVLIDGLTYSVKYLGIIAPLPGSKYSQVSKQKNIELTHTRSVILISGPVDKDATGSILRYFFAGETFINLELLRLGYVALDPNDPLDKNCKAIYQTAFDNALLSRAGIWAQDNNLQFFLTPTLRVYYVLPTDTAIPSDFTARPPKPTLAPKDCCRQCGTDSQPCGDICISLNKTCYVPSGCACK
jgi:endonuclease YncB( thermonuclease family)